MNARGFGRRREVHFEPPVEMRFVDLFMIIVVTLMFVTVMLIIFSAFVGATRVDVAPNIATKALPPALANQPYNLTLAGTGGVNPYLWKIENGTLPIGLALNSAEGVIYGVPTQLERRQFIVELTDAEKRSAKREVSLEVRFASKEQALQGNQIQVTRAAIILPDATRDAPYSFHFTAEGGSPPYTWETKNSKLPPGLNLTSSGDLIGTPSSNDPSSEFAVTITDAIGASASQNARILSNAPPLPLWRRILGWVVFILGWGVTVVGFLTLGSTCYLLLMGMPPADATAGWEGPLARWLRKRRY